MNDPDLGISKTMAESVDDLLGIGSQDDGSPDAKAHGLLLCLRITAVKSSGAPTVMKGGVL